MRISSRLLVLVGLLLSSRGSVAAAPFVSKEGGFTAAFPGKPEIESELVDAGDQKLPYHSFTVTLTDDLGLMLVSYLDYPDTGGFTPAQRLEATVSGQVTSQEGKLLSKKAISQGKIPGIEFAFETHRGQDLVSTMRNFLKGKRLYQVGVMIAKVTPVTAAQVQAYLDGFVISAK